MVVAAASTGRGEYGYDIMAAAAAAGASALVMNGTLSGQYMTSSYLPPNYCAKSSGHHLSRQNFLTRVSLWSRVESSRRRLSRQSLTRVR